MIRRVLLLLSVLLLAAPARAEPFTGIYAFGDSLSDVGNVFTATGGAVPAPPYVGGQFSNGPVWVQGLATGLGLPTLTPSLRGGTDFAYGGALSGPSSVHVANPTDLAGPFGQVAQYLAATATSDPGALYALWVGSNDIRAALAAGLDAGRFNAVLGEVAANVAGAVAALAADGARSFLLVLVPDLGLTPAARALGPQGQAAATAASAGLNSLLLGATGSVAARLGLDLRVLDTFGLLRQAVANPGAFGFSNVVDPCLAAGRLCAPDLAGQNRFLFWDDLHPTAAGHALIAQAALVAVPAPGGAVLLVGVAALLGLRRRGAALRRPADVKGLRDSRAGGGGYLPRAMRGERAA